MTHDLCAFVSCSDMQAASRSTECLNAHATVLVGAILIEALLQLVDQRASCRRGNFSSSHVKSDCCTPEPGIEPGSLA